MPSIYSLIYQRKWFIGMCLVWMTIRVTIYFSVSTNVGSFSHNQNQGSDKRALIPSRKSGSKDARILCWIPTSAKTKYRAELVKKTWGRHCDTLLFMSSEADEKLPTVVLPVNDSYATLWGKTQEALNHIYNHHLEDAEWFFKADDDTYAVMDNLRYFVRPLNHSLPLYLGSRRRIDGHLLYGYFEGGAGYLLSRESIRLFIEYGYRTDFAMCTSGHVGAEDVNLGECLEKIGVIFGESRDPQGRHRFLQFPLNEHFVGNYWLNNTNFHLSKKGFDCCSNTTVSFHKTKDEHLLEYDYLIHKLSKPKFNISNTKRDNDLKNNHDL